MLLDMGSWKLDAGNMPTSMKSLQKWLTSLIDNINECLCNIDEGNLEDAFYDTLKAGILEANKVISNTIITNNLYATYGSIAELTVDRLMSDNRVERYLNSDITDVNYIRIQDQSITFITGSTDGSATEQLTNRNGAALYWNEAGATISNYATIGMTATANAYPVLIYTYTEQIKAKISFEMDSDTGYYLPKITLGAGISTTNTLLGKSYIWKDTTGMTLRYTKINGVNVDLHIGEDGITGLTGNNSSVGIQLSFVENAESVTVGSAETVLGSISVSVSVTTDVPTNISLTAMPADATHLEVLVYLDNVLKLTRKFVALTTDEQNFCSTGILKDVAAGDHTVTFKAVADDADISVALGGFLGYSLIPGGAYQSYANGMVAYYALDDATDSGSLGLDLTAYGAVTYAAGKVGNCAVFNGASWLYIQSSMLTENLWDNRPFTISGWFKTTNTATEQNIVAANEGGYNNDAFKVGMYSVRPGIIQYNRENGAQSIYIRSVGTYADGNWHMIVCSYTGTAMVLDIDNGTEHITLESSIKVNHVTQLRIGSTDYNTTSGSQASGQEFVGSIDQVRFYDYALNTAEIADLWNGGAGK